MVTVLLIFAWFNLINASVISDRLIFPNLPIGVPNFENNSCSSESGLFLNGLENFTLWAHEMWDSSAKTANGVLEGRSYQIGNFDRCMDVKGPFPTQYCLGAISISVPTKNESLNLGPFGSVLDLLRTHQDPSRLLTYVGLCVPNSCTPIDLQNYLDLYLKTLRHPLISENVTYQSKLLPKLCQNQNEKVPFDFLNVAFCVLVATLLSLVGLATICDVKNRENKFLAPFSAKRNLSVLFENYDTMTMICGMKTVSICLVVIGHRLRLTASGPILNYDGMETRHAAKSYDFFSNGYYVVDTFFTISGLLMCYMLLNYFEKNQRKNPLLIILMRYIRLTPIFAVVVLFYASVFYSLGSGPFWKTAQRYRVNCRKTWWVSLLYLHNYVRIEHMCIGYAWYLACEFHYFVIGTFVVLLVDKRKKSGLSLLGLLILTSMVVPFVTVISYRFRNASSAFPDFLKSQKDDGNFQIFARSHLKATPYLVGIFAGYVCYKWKNRRISKKWSRIVTIVSTFALLLTSFVTPYFSKINESVVAFAFFASLSRFLWASGTAGLVFAGTFGHATLLRRVLSWYPFVPLSKLVYGVFIVHAVFGNYYSGAVKTSIYFSLWDVLCYSLSDLVLSFVFALVLYLSVETPSKLICKALLQSAGLSKNVPVVTEDNGEDLPLKHIL